MCNTEIGYLFDELLDTNRQLCEVLEELEKFKKAFELTCKELAEHDESELCDKTPISTRGQEGVEEYFLDEATRILEGHDDE